MPPRAIALPCLLALLAPGCWLAHSREPTPGGGLSDPADAGADASALARDAASPDASGNDEDAAGRTEDAAVPPLRCEITRADVSCFESFYFPAGTPFELPFAFDTCGCCAETECAVSVDAASATLSLTTTLCADPCDCDTCIAPRGSCAIPPLTEGSWRVVVNDAPAFDLPIVTTRPSHGPPVCVSYAQVDSCVAPFLTTWRPTATETVCVENGPNPSSYDVLHLRDPCGACQTVPGPCVARLEPRLTDDLPPGGELFIEAAESSTWCDVDCPGVCVPTDRVCVLPALVLGDTYRVHLGDRSVATFVAGDRTARCPR